MEVEKIAKITKLTKFDIFIELFFISILGIFCFSDIL